MKFLIVLLAAGGLAVVAYVYVLGPKDVEVYDYSINPKLEEVIVWLRVSGKTLVPSAGPKIELSGPGLARDFKLLAPDGTTYPATRAKFSPERIALRLDDLTPPAHISGFTEATWSFTRLPKRLELIVTFKVPADVLARHKRWEAYKAQLRNLTPRNLFEEKDD